MSKQCIQKNTNFLLTDFRCIYRTVALIGDLLKKYICVTQRMNQRASARETMGIGFNMLTNPSLSSKAN